MKILKLILPLILFMSALSFSGCDTASTESGNETSTANFQRVLDNYVLDNSSVLGIIASVEKPGGGFFRGTAGKYDINNSKPLEVSDKIHIGSATKTFIAAIVLQLMEEGMIELDSLLINYLPPDMAEILIDIPYGNEVSVYHALSHRSGIYNFTEYPNCERMVFEFDYIQCTPEYILTLVKDQGSPIFKPGEDYSYSNTNYILLGVVIEYLTNQKLNIALRERIYNRINLKDTYLSGFEARIGETARAYVNNIDCLTLNTGFTWAAGGMVSTVSDIMIFFQALNSGLLFQNSVTLELMKADMEDDNYALGFELNNSPQYGIMYGHSGGILGYVFLMCYSPETNTYLCTGITLQGPEIPDDSFIDPLIEYIQ